MQLKPTKIAKKYFHFIIAIILTLIFLYPLIENFSTHLNSRADGVFISWTIYTVSEFLYQGKNIFYLPIFYPFENTLTYSDPFLSTAVLTLPILLLTKNIVAIHNFHLIVGTLVMYVSTYTLAKQLKYSIIASHFSALIFTFSAIHLHYTVHLQSYLLAGIPLTFYFLIRWYYENKWQFLLLAFCSFLYQMLNSPMSGLFLSFALLPLVFEKKFWLKAKQHSILIGYYSLLSLVLLSLLYAPYFINSQQFAYVRTIRDTAHFAHSFERLFQPDLLIIYGLFFMFWKTRKKTGDLSTKHSVPQVKQLFLITIIGSILMLGPVLKIDGETVKFFGMPIPLPYGILYYVFPGFKAFRDSSRWILLVNFGISLIMGSFVTQSKLKDWHKILLFGILLCAYYFFQMQTFKLHNIPTTVPPIYESVKKQPEQVIAEFPVFSWRMMPYAYLENDRLLYQSYHKKTLLNGVSGFTPPIREQEWEWLWQEFPNNNTIEYLQNEGVELIIVHYKLYQEMSRANFIYKNTSTPDPTQLRSELNETLQLIVCKESSCLYLIQKTPHTM